MTFNAIYAEILIIQNYFLSWEAIEVTLTLTLTLITLIYYFKSNF